MMIVVIISVIVLGAMFNNEYKSDAAKAYAKGQITEEQNRQIQNGEPTSQAEALFQLIVLLAVAAGMIRGALGF